MPKIIIKLAKKKLLPISSVVIEILTNHIFILVRKKFISPEVNKRLCFEQ